MTTSEMLTMQRGAAIRLIRARFRRPVVVETSASTSAYKPGTLISSLIGSLDTLAGDEGNLGEVTF